MAKPDHIIEDIVLAHQAYKKTHGLAHIKFLVLVLHIQEDDWCEQPLVELQRAQLFSCCRTWKIECKHYFWSINREIPALRRKTRASVSTHEMKEVVTMDVL